jgi:hypothetical protein
MTATYAPEINATSAEHLARVRREYDLTVVDNALEDGCDDCGVGLDPRRPSGWEFDQVLNLLLCGNCVRETLRHEAQLNAATERGLCARGLHDTTDEANRYWAKNGHGRVALRCKPCYLEAGVKRKKAWREKRKAEQ